MKQLGYTAVPPGGSLPRGRPLSDSVGRVGRGGQTAIERGLSHAPAGPWSGRDAQDDADEVARISEDGQSGGTSRSAWVVRFVYRYLKCRCIIP